LIRAEFSKSNQKPMLILAKILAPIAPPMILLRFSPRLIRKYYHNLMHHSMVVGLSLGICFSTGLAAIWADTMPNVNNTNNNNGGNSNSSSQNIEKRELDGSCISLPTYGAENLRLIFRGDDEKSYVFLSGYRGGNLLWQRRFPWNEKAGFLNPAKTETHCYENQITITSKLPFAALSSVQVFNWQDQELNLISTQTIDPSAENLENLIRLAESGDAQGLERNTNTYRWIFYPARYITADKMTEAMERGRKSAWAEYGSGNIRGAIQRLELMFDLTVSLAEVLGVEGNGSGMNRWLNTWRKMEMLTTAYLPALADYGYFLYDSGQIKQSISVFQRVLRLDPEQTSLYLRLADALWQTQQIQRAQQNYQIFAERMRLENRSREIPKRVFERQ
jgi:tetratricopeptide (TPR) repeat protein